MKKSIIIGAYLLLISPCYGYDSKLNSESLNRESDIDLFSRNKVTLIKVGEPIEKSTILNILPKDYKFNKISSVGDCGGFLAESGNDNEDINQAGNIIINTMNDLAVISKVVNIGNGNSYDYKGLIINNSFTHRDINYTDFEVSEPEYNLEDEKFAIEITDIETSYDKVYRIRQLQSDDLLDLFFLNEKAVGFEVISQC